MLRIENIVKQYANHRALDNVSLTVEKGTIFGLLGPNGAGKTSLIRIINQITAPDEGAIFINGEKLKPSHISKIGYLPEERGLYKKMEIAEQMFYLARLKGLTKQQATERCKYWFAKMDMENWWKKKVEDLSKGMQQKVQFVATVIHEPELIILDEPFSGFDPINAEIIKDEILELNKKGTTIIFSTHRMESVEQLCDSIALLNKSKKVLDGRLKDIKNSYRTNSYYIEYIGEEIIPNASSPFEILSTEQLENTRQITIQLPPGAKVNDALHYLMPMAEIQQLKEVIPSINEIFIQQVKEIN
ncbi:MAG: ABC transporter ATP-binding protein [Pyrinomonadaceae bacterium]|nr:ABC transporter ATP-binding protein [Sphingobacteriaceae bacterium]